MWQVTQQRNVMQYGKLEEFVTLVTEMVPELLSSRQRTQLILGLRARMVLELCCSAGTADLLTIQAHLDIIHTLTETSLHKEVSHGDELDASDSNFVELVQTLLEDPSEREHFFQEVFPVHYGPRYDTALQTLVWEFLSRLEELLPVPDLTQVLRKTSHTESYRIPLVFLTWQYTVGEFNDVLSYPGHVSNYTTDTILSTLSLPPIIRVVINYEPDNSDNVRPFSDDDEDHNEILDEGTDRCLEDLGLSTSQEQEGLSPAETSVLVTPVPCDGKENKKGQTLIHLEKDRKQVDKKEEVVRKGDKKNVIKPVDKKKEGSPAPQNRAHVCECGKVFKKPSLLTLHMGVHTMPHHCDQCPKRYATPGALKKHQLLHTEERPFACEHCDRRYRSAYDLKVHVRIHSGERRHMCTICKKRFAHPSTLVRHTRMHAGEKNYLCSICGKAFLTSGEVQLHTRTHTGETPHTCKHCGKGFKASCHLTVHLRSHTGERPYTCTQCPKSFTTSDSLRTHIYTHTGEKPHRCSECGKTFTQRGNMVNHMRRIHRLRFSKSSPTERSTKSRKNALSSKETM
uniref:C2H2-type domain-containing protein n=1 Tax=Oncorhynchus kisutch TaxID=8019 RepID=A0A8C7CL25_ONCKI